MGICQFLDFELPVDVIHKRVGFVCETNIICIYSYRLECNALQQHRLLQRSNESYFFLFIIVCHDDLVRILIDVKGHDAIILFRSACFIFCDKETIHKLPFNMTQYIGKLLKCDTCVMVYSANVNGSFFFLTVINLT